ncbi:hypothetical protein N7505_001266 [Penicillium chrysogenum]|uniref:Uncharacterized protein n=1 Tax=Penicillium chrysogenum TaxID=5076 RepID=A0ABQ8WWJ6_PENCH|nr:hypothetical protein N7505_001266 [Penicillium chrysogenum]
MAGRLADRQPAASTDRVPTIRSTITAPRSSSYPPPTDENNETLGPSNISNKFNEQNLAYDREVKTASTELLNDVRVESTSTSGGRLLRILMETEQDMRKQRRKRLNKGEGYVNDGSTLHGG